MPLTRTDPVLPDHLNLAQRAKLLGIDGFDTALPQDFVNDFVKRTGYNPVGDLVWLYRVHRVNDAGVQVEDSYTFGVPFATTPYGQVMLLQFLNQGGRY